MKKKKEKKDDLAGLAVPAGLLIGIGLGFLYNSLLPGLFIGLGSGFLIVLILKLILKK